MDQCSIAQARDQFTQLVYKVEAGEKIEVTRRGQRVAVILSAEEYDRLSQPKQGFGEAILAWRKEYGLDDRPEDETDREFEEIMSTVREKSSGREPFEW